MATIASLARSPKPRPREPTNIDHIICQNGGSTTAIELLPSQLEKLKRQRDPAVGVKELWQTIGRLRAENKWLRDRLDSLMRFRERELWALKDKESALRESAAALEASDQSFLELCDIVPDSIGASLVDVL